MNEPVAIVRNHRHSHRLVTRVAHAGRRTAPVNVEIGNGAIAPKVAIKRAQSQSPVNVEIGNGAIAPKVAIARRASTARR